MSAESWAEEVFVRHVLAGHLARRFSAAGIGDPGEVYVVSSELPVGEVLACRPRQIIAVVSGDDADEIELIRIRRLA